MTSKPGYESFLLDWRGYRIEVRYAADWLGNGYTAHLELETIEPPRAPLPITETGYRSHFHPVGSIDDALSFVEGWLNEAAKSRGWRDQVEAGRQLSLL